MKQYLFTVCILLVIPLSLSAQKFYTTSGGEILFQSSILESANDDVNSNLRFSAAFHLGEFIHADFGNHFGLFSGIGIRNIGMISNENDVKIKYRSYNLGIPLAVKAGSLKKDLYIFGGAEYEWMFNFKQKTFRDGGKYKFSSWFSQRTPDFIPSVFAGVQFPGGIQLKFKYYLEDFLNHRFIGNDIYNDYSKFTKTQVWYISVSYQVRNARARKKDSAPIEIAEANF